MNSKMSFRHIIICKHICNICNYIMNMNNNINLNTGIRMFNAGQLPAVPLPQPCDSGVNNLKKMVFRVSRKEKLLIILTSLIFFYC